jgi:alpha-L-fucosidase 2
LNRREFVQSLLAAANLPLTRIPSRLAPQVQGDPSAPGTLNPALWYSRAATRWVEALPIGNGRLGAMVFGDVSRERLQLNDDTLWSGGPAAWDTPGAREVLPELRRLTLAGRYADADRLAKRMMGSFTQSYLPLGDLWLTPEHGNIAREYRRELHLRDAVASVRYRVGDVRYTREVMASHPAGIIAIRLTAERPGMLTFDAQLSSALRHLVTAEDGWLRLHGVAPAHVDPSYYSTDVPVQYGREGGRAGGHWAAGETPRAKEGRRTLPGMRFEVALAATADGGRVSATPSGLRVEGADAVTLLVGSATAFDGFDKDPALHGRDPGPIVLASIRQSLATPWPELRGAHVADHRALFDRVSLELPATPPDDLPIDQRILARGSGDAGLVQLLFQYGRYLLIASSRAGTQPANLQGIWNEDVRAPWSSNYTININTQMNYWPAETAALPELHEPLLTFIGGLAANGARTAAAMYGARGWTAHHNSDLWRHSGMVGDWGAGDPVWAAWPMGGPWLAQHLYEHYLFGGDAAYLRERAYPLLRGAAEFCLDSLVPGAAGHLVTAPSTSPENKFRLPTGVACAISPGATMDLAVIRDLFANTADAADALGTDAAFRTQLLDARAKLRPYAIGSKGQLLEWVEEFAEPEPEHRHISHLFGLHPGRHITPATPALFAAVRRSHELRGDGGTGWSLAWKVNHWARLLDGDHAFRMLTTLLTLVNTSDPNYRGGGGVYANLFDAHPPFQIDGNFGATAGIIEMLAQSHAGEIHLLPALPRAWPAGRLRGIRLRGGFDADIEWSGGALVRAVLRSRLGGIARVRTANTVTVSGGPARPAAGANPNPFYRVHDPGAPVVTPSAPAAILVPPRGVVIDISTERGAQVELRG